MSDYTYEGVMAFHETQGTVATPERIGKSPQLCLVVWGRVDQGRPILEPAFLIKTRPMLPASSGPYRVEALDDRGGQIFSLAFETSPVADGMKQEEHFAFAIPVESSAVAHLTRLRLISSSGTAEQTSQLGTSGFSEKAIETSRSAGRLRIDWSGTMSRVVMVRDAVTGDVLAIGRGTSVEISERTALEVHLSNGVSSRRVDLRNP